MKLMVLAAALVVLITACSSLETPEFRGPGRAPNGVPFGSNPSISDDIHLAWPVFGGVHINQPFRTGNKKTRHQGLDIGGTKNRPILAAHDGYAIYVGRGFHGYGRMIILESKDKSFVTFYAHLNEATVREGRFVHMGDTIGKMGRTGHATGVHLHFELRIANLAVDPTPYLPKRLN